MVESAIKFYQKNTEAMTGMVPPSVEEALNLRSDEEFSMMVESTKGMIKNLSPHMGKLFRLRIFREIIKIAGPIA